MTYHFSLKSEVTEVKNEPEILSAGVYLKYNFIIKFNLRGAGNGLL